ncbi:hypothetical protein ACFVFD_07940 [Streptomyces fimicarius]|nr:hypothetical protein [Streptomyces sp. BPSDS2]
MPAEHARAPRLTRRYHLDLCHLAGGLCPAASGTSSRTRTAR